MAGALNECFSSGRANAHVPTTTTTTTSTIKTDNDQQLASSENAVRHASEVAGLGPVQNIAAAGSSIDRQATGYYAGAGGTYPSAPPIGNSATPLVHNHNNHNHIRMPQFENATTQSTGHDRTGVGGGRNSNIDAGDKHAGGSGGLPLAAEHPTAQPNCKQRGIRYEIEMTRAYDTPSSLGLTEVVGLC
jgi:hypothetical protein